MLLLNTEYGREVMADRHREAEHARLIRDVARAAKAEKTIQPKRRRFLRLRDPLKA